MFRTVPFCALLILHCYAQNTDIIKLSNNLSRELHAITNLVYAFQATSQFAAIIANLTLPKIIVTSNTTHALRYTFDMPILALILLESPTDISWQHTFFATLARLYHADALFLWPNAFTKDTDLWTPLFEFCWQHGFYNLLLADEHGQLLTVAPFPQLRVVSTTLTSYLKNRRNGWHDLHGHPLRILYAHDPPHTIIYRHPRTGERQFSGAAAQVFAAFAQRYNATIEPSFMPSSGAFNASINNVCSEQLRTRLVDACSEWDIYSAKGVVSTPLQFYNVYLMVRYAPPLSKFYYFQVPFQAKTWLAIAASICLVTLATTLLTWLQSAEWHFGRLGLDVCASFLCLTFNLRPLRSLLRKTMFLTLYLNGFILSNLYLGYLSSILSKSVYEPQIKTLNDFRRSNITVMAHEYQTFVLAQYGVFDIVADRLLNVSYETFLEHRNNFDTNYAYVNNHITQEFLAYQQKLLSRPIMQKLENPIFFALAGHAIRDSWALEQLFNKHTQEMFAAGLYKRLREEAYEKTILLGYASYAKMERLGVRPLGMEYISMPVLLLGFGFSLGVIVLLLELLCYKLKTAWKFRSAQF